MTLFDPNLPKVYKNKDLNHSNFADFTHTDYQVFLHLISKIGGIDWEGKYIQTEKLERKHILTALEFSKTFNLPPTHSYAVLKKAVNRLMKTDIKIPREGGCYLRINVCSLAEYKNKEGLIEIEFTDRIMPYLAQVKEKFLLYNLKEVSNFQSLYSTRLYELIQEFKETGWMLKSIEQLRDSFAVEGKFTKYADLKRRTFGHACKEINSLYKMGLSFEEIKEGRRVVAVKFFFKKTTVRQIINKKTGYKRNIYQKPKIAITPKKRMSPKSKTEAVIIEGQMELREQKPNMDRKPRSVSNVLSSMLPNIFSKKK